MTSFRKRLAYLLHRLHWMSGLTGSVTQSLALILQVRFNMTAAHTMFTLSGPVRFRGIDEQALKEVLVDCEYAFLKELVQGRKEPRVIDVGAHIGTFALWVLETNPHACIVSVEADPRTYELLEQNAALRQDAGLDWTVLHAAAGTYDGETVRLSDDGPSMSHRVDSQGRVEVSTVGLATLLERAAGADGTIDLMKIDIEGSEEAFLAKTGDLLGRVNAVVIELHPSLCDTDRVCAVLNAHYDVITKAGNRYSSKPLLYCRRGG